jgi:succinate dehydrogenase hydrophobic anchor subunit
MKPTPRDWLAAALLAVVLLALALVLVVVAIPADEGAGAIVRALA